MNKTKVCLIVGTRPQIIKSAPILKALVNDDFIVQLVHTGQHYDYQLSKAFFDEMDIMNPTLNLEVGSGTHVWQISQILSRLEHPLLKLEPDVVVVPGDTNSALASALVASKLKIKLAHVEAGARSNDFTAPEEINRRLIDHCSEILFAPTRNCLDNLRKESVFGKSYMVGDTMYDAFLENYDKIKRSKIRERLGINSKQLAAVTIHRTENVDVKANLHMVIEILNGINEQGIEVVFPMHPHTRSRLEEFKISYKGITVVDPLGYFDMLKLVEEASVVLTDSGGLQKEAFWLHVPCITLRNSTEWEETVKLKVNFVFGLNKKVILNKVHAIINNSDFRKRFRDIRNPFGDGRASKRIVSLLSGIK